MAKKSITGLTLKILPKKGADGQIYAARLSFTDDLFVARPYKGDKDKKSFYSCQLLIPKQHPQVGEITSELTRLAREAYGAEADQIVKGMRAEGKIAFGDGDNKRYEGYAGNYFIRAKNEKLPTYLRANPGTKDNPNRITSPTELPSGCFVAAYISFWAMNNDWGQRLNCNLLGLQFYKPGEAFSGGGVSAPVDEFETLDEGPDTLGAVAGADMFT